MMVRKVLACGLAAVLVTGCVGAGELPTPTVSGTVTITPTPSTTSGAPTPSISLQGPSYVDGAGKNLPSPYVDKDGNVDNHNWVEGRIEDLPDAEAMRQIRSVVRSWWYYYIYVRWDSPEGFGTWINAVRPYTTPAYWKRIDAHFAEAGGLAADWRIFKESKLVSQAEVTNIAIETRVPFTKTEYWVNLNLYTIQHRGDRSRDPVLHSAPKFEMVQVQKVDGKWLVSNVPALVMDPRPTF